MKTSLNKINIFLIRLIKLVGFVAVAYFSTLFVTEMFGGVNPLVEFSSIGFSKIESADSRDKIGLAVAYQACKENLNDSDVSYEYPDGSYQAWSLNKGRFLIRAKVYEHADSGSPVEANLMCQILKTEDDEFLASHWQVQGLKIDRL